MYGRPDLYGSSALSAGLTQDRVRRLMSQASSDLGSDDPDEVELEDELDDDLDDDLLYEDDDAFDDQDDPYEEYDEDYGEISSSSSVPHQVATALRSFVARPAQVQGDTIYAQLQGPTWPHALQAVAKAARANRMAVRIVVSDTELPLRGVVPVVLELVPYGV